MDIIEVNETSILIEFGETINEDIQEIVKAFCEYLDKHPFKGMVEYIPAFSSVAVIYNPMESNYEEVYLILKNILCNLKLPYEKNRRIVKIPVCYGDKFGPDIQYVADYNKISIDEVVKIHSKGKYIVYMIGFAPGFPYLGGMSKSIATPRRKSPRTAIPKGAVGIAGEQTGVYPISTPGGWQIIGSTPLKLFRPEEEPPTLLRAGDIVKFYPISFEEYEEMGNKK
ncbi:kinase A inhibitor [Clostridium pasteurianum DSM 525 = ATCC 6013]|uniref:Kinase A inhibitor n=1 Tax=Clostridium pasteurianum DSM 525 = ATCC 6013 TaxID=1262449 RepID=A0A0H3J8X8_CLOPA|nr:5-oxoprolinase subunit PxpB [Clostridium pasteurianum]AJA49954.1 kinase A inhibitor [Clostridium pasteurianum DSM 525 = ATCC 6013]AJA53942.1 kinase A inhibitor [Clostridium pasteurianum DSM 525 = ATCC 6013]AOZ77088.1 kinase inhibitor [Clostridium pasteurianum DSM 525 = ATCC 6013]AOZ80885.1 kinase inhibitor [Clostridium pasteurianum]ELP59334.1 allophanate hydrolase subunit 1 [Clostridium pasteurianum DSM 525 = ATCC 6013]